MQPLHQPQGRALLPPGLARLVSSPRALWQLLTTLLVSAHMCHAYPSYYSGCQLSVGEQAMGHTVTEVPAGHGDCNVANFPTEFFEGEEYDISLNGAGGLRFLVSVDSGTLTQKGSNSFTSKSGCNGAGAHGNLDTVVTWTTGSDESATITLTCGSSSFGLRQASASASKIEPVTCSSPPSVDNGTPCASATTRDPGCEVTCDSGYELTTNTLECQDSGSFTGSATCSDIDACENHDVCDENSNGCMDIEGGPDSEDGITCGGCTTGYSGDGFTCVDTNGCDPNPCDVNAECADVPAPGTGATCTCNDGFYGNGSVCTACTECPSDTYAVGECHTTADDFDGCDACPGNSTSPAGSTSINNCTCLTGFVRSDTQSGFACEEKVCEDGEFLDGGDCALCTPTTCSAGEELQGQCGGKQNTLVCVACTGVTAKENPGPDSCQRCNSGTEPNDDHTACVPCPEAYAGQDGACSQCIDGTEPSDDASACGSCPTGTAGVGGVCSPCLASEVPSVDRTACIPCGSNMIPNMAQTDCVCDATSVAAGTMCQRCLDGTEPNNDQSACVPCSANSAGVLGSCSVCPAGREADNNATACVRCIASHVRATADPSDNCEECNPGLQASADRTMCVPCAANAVRPAGWHQCTLCDNGQRPNAESSACVPCPLGLAGTEGLCSQCPGSTVPNENRTACVACPGDSRVSQDGEQCVPPSCDESSKEGVACAPCLGCNCPATHVAHTENPLTCKLCPSDLVPSQGLCRPCPSNRVAFRGRCRECASGYGVANATACLRCRGLSISMDGLCVPCPAGMVPTEAHTSCTNSTTEVIYFTLDYSQLSGDPALQQQLIDNLLAALEARGIDVGAILDVQLRPGSTIAELSGAAWALEQTKTAAAEGSLGVEHEGETLVAGDTVSDDGTVISSSAEGSSDNTGSGASAASASGIDSGAVAGIFIGVFGGAFLVFYLISRRAQPTVHTLDLETELSSKTPESATANSPEPWESWEACSL